MQELDIKKLDGKSLDIAEADKEKLKAVFPQCFNEGKLDTTKLLALVGEYEDNDFEKYKFEWKGKSNCLRIAGKRSTGTLRPCPEESVDFENTNNLYIEGDNLEVLKLLQTAYYRKVKMIYIDPPYNTGNDFVYEDDFKDPLAKYKEITSQTTKSNPETMGRYHTNWLNMMYPRLRLAANLLRDDGVIFISIDDNEVDNLKKICNEVFGEENFIAQITREAIKGGSQSKYIRVTHDYILIYSKNINDVEFGGVEVEGRTLNLQDEKGAYAKGRELNKWGAGSRREDSPSMYFPIKGPNGEDVYPIRNDGTEGRWRLGKEKMHKKVNDGDVIFEKRSDGTYIVYEKIRDDSNREKQFISIFKDEYINAKGTEEIKKLFQIEKSYFDYAKPVNLVNDLILMSKVSDEDIVLDFFSGSATTAHAVMQLNAEDGGKRQFIMVQLPELTDEKSEAFKAGYKNICEIGKERIRRAGKKILEDLKRKETLIKKGVTAIKSSNSTINEYGDIENPTLCHYEDYRGQDRTQEEYAEVTKNLDVGFKVLKLDTSNLVKWDDTPLDSTDTEVLKERFDTMIKSLKIDRSELDVVYEVMLKLGIPATYKVFENNLNGRKVYSIGEDGLILVCLDGSNGGITPEDVTAMCELSPAKIVAAEEAFKDDVALSNAFYISKDSGVEIMLL